MYRVILYIYCSIIKLPLHIVLFYKKTEISERITRIYSVMNILSKN